MNETIIEIQNVVYEYDAYTMDDEKVTERALDGVSLSIKKGEYLVVLGHNGSGKSTLAKLINGQNLPTEGDVFVNGMNTKEEDNTWEIRKTCGMVFQNPDNQMVATIVEEDVAFRQRICASPTPSCGKEWMAP